MKTYSKTDVISIKLDKVPRLQNKLRGLPTNKQCDLG